MSDRKTKIQNQPMPQSTELESEELNVDDLDRVVGGLYGMPGSHKDKNKEIHGAPFLNNVNYM
ncbi:MAG: hypothetical protein J7647_28275 [Cyanobacteria bacterium SBLK]|nr:hypothetical protein [Cyanobacteria bacterium SBLK]